MKTAIFYAYYETDQSMYNLEFFAKIGITNDPNYLFVITINGDNCSVKLPKQDNVIILVKDNTGFDFGSHGYAIGYLLSMHNLKENEVDKLPFDNFIFMNCGVIGPFLPSYFPENKHWSAIFTDKLINDVKLVGTTIVCLPPTDKGGYGPRIEGFCFGTDRIGLKLIADNGKIFANHKNKIDAVLNGEYALSRLILEKGYNLDCLLYKYHGVDWRDKKNWSVFPHPSRLGSYEGISIHPFEVVFHKWYWSYSPEKLVLFDYVNKYRQWKLGKLKKDI